MNTRYIETRPNGTKFWTKDGWELRKVWSLLVKLKVIRPGDNV